MKTKKSPPKKDLFSKKRAYTFDEALGNLGVYRSSVKKVKQQTLSEIKQVV